MLMAAVIMDGHETFLIDLGVKLAHEEKTPRVLPDSPWFCGPFRVSSWTRKPPSFASCLRFPTLDLFTDGGFSAMFVESDSFPNHPTVRSLFFSPLLRVVWLWGLSSWLLATKRTSLVKYSFIQPEMIMEHMTCSQDAREDYIYRCTSWIKANP